ncbi:MAG: fused MFS/spermidine synthase [Chloroflexi bacterium]|nr:fused MFS/spermidine synthase [Chloroflexota bacterium]
MSNFQGADLNLFILRWMVFLSGAAVMGIEMAASRLLRPFFGDSILIWANIIGLIMIYLTAGYFLGGRWADRDPRPTTFYRILAWAGFAIGVLPFIAKPFLDLAIPALEQFDAGLGFVSFAGTLALFVVPITLLGCVSPFAIRLSTRDVSSSGSTAGNLYSLSTFGSIVGVFGTVFVLLAIFGTRGTYVAFSIALLASAIVGLARESRGRALRYAILLAIVIALALFASSGIIKQSAGLVYETESFYNFIQVIDDGGWRLLTVNEGQAYQSAYRADRVLSGGIWDLFLIAPFFASHEPSTSSGQTPRNVLMIGLAAGTVARAYTEIYPAIPIDGVELDPAIIAVGQNYFAMTQPNLTAIAGDGRAFMRRAGEYAVIAIDAYRQPYIPFHLTTVEFFRETRAHLAPRGVVALNAARAPNDYRLVDALAATMRQVFPSVYLIDHPNNANTLIVATNEPTRLDDFRANVAVLRDPNLQIVAAQALPSARVAEQIEPVFTDDHAPVENLINDIIFRYALGQ